VKEKGQEGQCRCGEVRFRAGGAPLITMACHCRGCQRMSASAFSLNSLYPEDRFEVTAGEPVLGGIKGTSRHYFCPSCMTWVFTRPDALDGFVNARSAMFELAADHRPFMETYASEAVGWATTGAERSFEGVPQENQFSELLGAYAEWDGRVKA
jgi:hypothetical protein